MRTLHIFFAICLMIIYPKTQAFGQSDSKTIEADFNEYLRLLLNQKFAASTEYIVEDLFDILPKEQMVKVMEATFNTPDMDLKLYDPNIITISDSQMIEGVKYAKLRYSNGMSMRMTGEGQESLDSEALATQNAIIQSQLNSTFGIDNVSYKEDTNTFHILAEKDVVAVRKESYNTWKFLVLEKAQIPILKQFLPDGLLEKL